MAKKTAAELVAFVKSKLGTAYVYGAKGENLTQAQYNALKARYGSMVWDSDIKKVGKICVDCSGLISWLTGTIRNSANFKATATKILPISKISQAVAGCAVWRSGHIGVYIGDGYIIEARGSAYGVVKTKASARDFTHILWLADIDYSAKETVKTSAGVSYYPKTPYTGVSLVEGLKAIGVDSSLTTRKKIAEVNGISNYKGSAEHNTKLLNLLKAGKLIKSSAATVKKHFAKTSYKGISLVEGLKAIGVDSSFTSRKKIAAVNGVKTYSGTPAQNTMLLTLLKAGKLVKP